MGSATLQYFVWESLTVWSLTDGCGTTMKLKDFERNPQDAVRKNITSGREGVRVICGRVQIPGKGMFTMLTLR